MIITFYCFLHVQICKKKPNIWQNGNHPILRAQRKIEFKSYLESLDHIYAALMHSITDWSYWENWIWIWEPDKEDQQEGISSCQREDQSPLLFPNKFSSIATNKTMSPNSPKSAKLTKTIKETKFRKKEEPLKLRGECKASLSSSLLMLFHFHSTSDPNNLCQEPKYTQQIQNFTP